MNSSWNNQNNSVIWHKSNNSSYNKPNNQTSYINSNNQTSYINSNNQTSYVKSNNQISRNNSNIKTSLNKPTKKMAIAIVLGVFVLVSCICVLCLNASEKNDKENSTEDSNKMVNNYSDTDDFWTVDDQPEDNISNSDMASGENNVDVANSGEEIQENTTEEIITGSASTTETEQPIETTIPTETSRPTVTTRPTEITTPVSTPAPTVAPIATPRPIATPQPVITEYASLVTPFTNKDSYGQIVYILANSENRYYSVSELQSLTNEQLRFARNEIFARRGGRFASSDLHQYFSSRSWYVPTRMAEDFEDEDLNAYEIENIKLIQSVERSR